MAFVGVDVGTGSARAGVFDISGKLLGEASVAIQMRKPFPEHFEYSSEDIWQACCRAVRAAHASAGGVKVAGLAFDATCSLVVLGAGGQPLAVGSELPDEPAASGADAQPIFNVIAWCDHRATTEAAAINATGHRLLANVGGAVSPEMEMPKLAWLKQRRPRTFAAARYFLDLADFLAHRAADGGDDLALRSICTVVCKWNFDAEARSWDDMFLEAVGLSDIGIHRIGEPSHVRDVGASVSGGVGQRAAAELGLVAGTSLGIGAIDAHVGGIGCLGADPASVKGAPPPPLAARLALIAGTSACHMASSSRPVFVPGVWGPYDSAMVPGLFLNEGGQSAAGAALDFIVETHAAYPALRAEAETKGLRETQVLNAHVTALAEARGLEHLALLTAGVFVGPDLNGNRSPLADPHLRGSVVGLGPVGQAEAARSLDHLAVIYLAAVQALAYSTRAIVDAVNAARRKAASGHCGEGPELEPVAAIFVCGGLAQNELYVSEHADVLGMPMHLPREPAAVLLGSAMLAASAAGAFSSVEGAMRAMGQESSTVAPTADGGLRRFHDARYEIFRRMQRHQQEYLELERAALEG